MATTAYFLNQYITTTLNVGGGIDASQTTGIILTSVTGVDITKPGVALINYADPLNTTIAEWVTYTSINGSNELQGVTRGAEGFSAKTHSNGVSIAFPISESHINNLATGLMIGGSATNILEGVLDEDTMSSDSATKVPTQQSVKAYVDAAASASGWIAAGETWTYAAADDPTFTFTIAGVDKTTKYYPGMKVKLTQTTAKYFIITKVAFSTDTTVTLYGGTDYDLANAAITSPFYSVAKSPTAFPMDPTKWMVKVTDTSNRTQATPTQNTWYNPGTISITIPIGAWDVDYRADIQVEDSAATTTVSVEATLSTANNSESDNEYTVRSILGVVANTGQVEAPVYVRKYEVLTAKSTRYLNVQSVSASMDAIYIRGDNATTVIRAICAYL